MAARKLRPVGDDERLVLPKTLSEAVEMDRRTFLVRSRLEIAQVVDGGVPPHALGRLLADLMEVDAEIRRLDSQNEEEEGDASHLADEAFNAEAI